jgi:hypothetical protein
MQYRVLRLEPIKGKLLVMPLPPVVLAVTFTVDTGDPNIVYCGYDAGVARDYASWAVRNEAHINLAYIFIHPEPSTVIGKIICNLRGLARLKKNPKDTFRQSIPGNIPSEPRAI